MESKPPTPEEIVAKIRERVRARYPHGSRSFLPQVVANVPDSKMSGPTVSNSLDLLRKEVTDANLSHNLVGTVNPRSPGLHNQFAQFIKRVMRRSLTWYTRPLHQFHGSVARALMHIVVALESVQAAVHEVTRNQEQVKHALAQTEARHRSEFRQHLRETLRTADTPDGPKAAAGLWFNDAIWVGYEENGKANWSATSERVVERAWLFRQFSRFPVGSKVLDVGCTESLVALELASSGFAVTGIDIREYVLQHPNLQFVRADICENHLESSKYDAVIALSTIEHIGIGSYGDRKQDGADATAIKEIIRLLKPGGYLLATVPFGHGAVTPLHRIYDPSTLRGLLKGLSIEKLEFAARIDAKTWISPVDEETAAANKHDSNFFPCAVALVVCRKPAKGN